jgi:hypothetical protein
LSETFLTVRRTVPDIIKKAHRSSCQEPVIIVKFQTDFRKNNKMSIVMKIGTMGAELFCVDGQTDMTKLIVTFLKQEKWQRTNPVAMM